MPTLKQRMNHHVKNYVDAVFAHRLREEGFTCPDDKSLCWYRVNSNGIVNSVFFHTRYRGIPIVLSLGYGIHPLFQRTAYISNVYDLNVPFDESFLTAALEEPGARILTPYNMTDACIMIPKSNGMGIYTLTDIILPKMKKAKTMESCYELHRERIEECHALLSGTYIDEALYFNDESRFDACVSMADKTFKLYKSQSETYPNDQQYRILLREWQERLNALQDGKHEEYMCILEQRKQANIRFMRKKLKLDI